MLALFFAAFGAVFVAEIARDALRGTVGVLATRVHPSPIVAGVGIRLLPAIRSVIETLAEGDP